MLRLKLRAINLKLDVSRLGSSGPSFSGAPAPGQRPVCWAIQDRASVERVFAGGMLEGGEGGEGGGGGGIVLHYRGFTFKPETASPPST